MKTLVMVMMLGVVGCTGCGSEVDGSVVPPAARPQDEAIQNVREIAAAAKAHFDKTGKLCGSAAPVPAALTSVMGARYTPSTAVSPEYGSADFGSGTDDAGWKCLGWKPSQSTIGYMLSYQIGSGYMAGGSMAGAPDPGAAGFEASAQGDLDGDATPSTFALGGSVVDGKLVPLTLFVDHESE
jgi:hypothetical protein